MNEIILPLKLQGKLTDYMNEIVGAYDCVDLHNFINEQYLNDDSGVIYNKVTFKAASAVEVTELLNNGADIFTVNALIKHVDYDDTYFYKRDGVWWSKPLFELKYVPVYCIVNLLENVVKFLDRLREDYSSLYYLYDYIETELKQEGLIK